MNCYFAELKRFLDFRGRTNNRSYWMFLLTAFIFSLGAITLSEFLNVNPMAILQLYFLFLLIPTISLHVRRYNDIKINFKEKKEKKM